jgi:tRNA1(Val) A37 N6-methylase TrmN6
MRAQVFEQYINELKFSSFNEKIETGILYTGGFDFTWKLHTADILFAMDNAKNKFDADAVYFHASPNKEYSVAQIYLFDNTFGKYDKKAKIELHKKMWNASHIPLYIIIERTAVNIYDSRKKPDINNEEYAESIIKLSADSLNQFNAREFDDGLFWEKHEKKNFDFNDSAASDLIRGLKLVYEQFQKDSGLDKHIALKLLMQCILLKYLEERDDEQGYFAKSYFQKYFGSKNFCDVIRNGKLIELLDELSNDFNGKIFRWDEKDDAEKEARKAIKSAKIKGLAEFLDANIQDNQYVLWKLYSFSYLPVEIISLVYEELLASSKDVTYTPEMIVNLMIDECMPLRTPIENFKLMDASCGSGIFLVKAYKRIIQWWRYSEWKKTGELKKPSLSTLKNLLLKSIYGIDIQQDAVNLAIFSLSLALLDEVDLNPPTWKRLKFDDLSKNIAEKDFFIYVSQNPELKFDLVIGNPPFNLPPAEGKKREPSRKKYFSELKLQHNYRVELNIPDENPALHFLVKTTSWLSENGTLCLIQPSGPLFFQNEEFRKELFLRHNIYQVIDFTKLSAVLWNGKNVATAIVFIKNTLEFESVITHVVTNQVICNKKRLFLEFDHYDFHYIDREDCIHKPFVWRTNLVGGGRITDLIDRLSKYKTMKEYLDKKCKTQKWKYAEGYILNPKTHRADFIFGKKRVRPEFLTEDGVEKTDIEENLYFHRTREKSKEIFLAPHILIKEEIGKIKNIPVDFLDYDAVFSDIIVGIYAPKEQEDELRKLYFTFNENKSYLYRFFIMATSPKLFVNMAGVFLKKDIDNLPYPTKNIELSEVDKIVMDDVIRYQFSKKKELLKPADDSDIYAFSEVFCKTLNVMYKSNDKEFYLYKVIDVNTFYVLHFEYGKSVLPKFVKHTDLDDYIDKIIFQSTDSPDSYRINKILKIYDNDKLIIAKPKIKKYWLRSIALRDADVTVAEYIEARHSK